MRCHTAIPTWNDSVIAVIPQEHILSLLHHYTKIAFPEFCSPINRGQRVAPNIERKALPKLHRRSFVKITVDYTGSKRGRSLRAPYNTVKLLPRVAEVKPVKVNDDEFSGFINHHIADMVIAMLKRLGMAYKNIAIVSQVCDNLIVAVETDTAVFIFLDFVIGFAVETGMPILLRSGRGNRMDLF